MSWQIQLTKQAQKDALKLKRIGLLDKARQLRLVLSENPFTNPPPYEKLTGDLEGYYSRRINIQHRMVYQVIKDIKTVKILRMWSHYE